MIHEMKTLDRTRYPNPKQSTSSLAFHVDTVICHVIDPGLSNDSIGLPTFHTDQLKPTEEDPRWHVDGHQLKHIDIAYLWFLSTTPTVPNSQSSSKIEMASLAASTAAASLGVSEMLGNPLNFSGGVARSAPTASSPATFKTVALFSKKKPSPPPKAKPAAVSAIDDELAKWYGKLLSKFASHFSTRINFFNLDPQLS